MMTRKSQAGRVMLSPLIVAEPENDSGTAEKTAKLEKIGLWALVGLVLAAGVLFFFQAVTKAS